MQPILMDIKGEINSNTVIADFNTPLRSMDTSFRQKQNKTKQQQGNGILKWCTRSDGFV